VASLKDDGFNAKNRRRQINQFLDNFQKSIQNPLEKPAARLSKPKYSPSVKEWNI